MIRICEPRLRYGVLGGSLMSSCIDSLKVDSQSAGYDTASLDDIEVLATTQTDCENGKLRNPGEARESLSSDAGKLRRAEFNLGDSPGTTQACQECTPQN